MLIYTQSKHELTMKIIMQLFLIHIVLVFITSTHLVYSQNHKQLIDSLEQRLDFLEGKEKVFNLKKLSQAYMYLEPSHSLIYAQKALELSKFLTNDTLIAQSEEYIATVYEQQKQQKTALKHYKNALEISKKLQDKEKELALNQNLANLYWYLQDFEQAINYKMINLSFYETQKYWLKAGRFSYNLALLCQRQLKDNLALEFFEKAVRYFNNAKNLQTLAVALQDLAEQQEKLNQTNHALINYLKASPLLKKQNNYVKVPQNLWAIATLYKNKKLYPYSLMYFQDLKKWSTQVGNQQQKLETIYEIAHIYIQNKQYQKALLEVKEGIELSQEFRFDKDKLHQIHVNVYILMQEYQKAFLYQNEYLLLKTLKNAKFVSDTPIVKGND